MGPKPKWRKRYEINLFTQTKHSITSSLATFSIFNRKTNRANLYFIPLHATTSRKRQLSAVPKGRAATGLGVTQDCRLNKYLQGTSSADTSYSVLSASVASVARRVASRVAHTRRASCKSPVWARRCRCDVTYKVATHRRAVNAGRAYCLRSRDEPFSRAPRRRRRPVNRKGGG